jgi:hypothetical protein
MSLNAGGGARDGFSFEVRIYCIKQVLHEIILLCPRGKDPPSPHFLSSCSFPFMLRRGIISFREPSSNATCYVYIRR